MSARLQLAVEVRRCFVWASGSIETIGRQILSHMNILLRQWTRNTTKLQCRTLAGFTRHYLGKGWPNGTLPSRKIQLAVGEWNLKITESLGRICSRLSLYFGWHDELRLSEMEDGPERHVFIRALRVRPPRPANADIWWLVWTRWKLVTAREFRALNQTTWDSKRGK